MPFVGEGLKKKLGEYGKLTGFSPVEIQAKKPGKRTSPDQFKQNRFGTFFTKRKTEKRGVRVLGGVRGAP